MTETTQHVQWPPERLYWAVLDGSLLPAAGRRTWGRGRQRLGYLFERMLPGIPIEQMHAVYRKLGKEGLFLACGVTEDVLKGIDVSAVTLTPAALPSFLDDPVDPASLNLLTGRFLPGAVRRYRRRWLVQMAVLLIACASILLAGIDRRVAAARVQLDVVTAAKARLLTEILGADALSSGPAGRPADLRLIAEFRRLQQTRAEGNPVLETSACSTVLSDLLSLWPEDVHVKAESLSITPTQIAVRAQVPRMIDAQRLADALVAMPGWRLGQPQSESKRDHVEVMLRFEPQQPEVAP